MKNRWLYLPLDHGAPDPQHWLIVTRTDQDGWVGLAEIFGRYDAERLVRHHNESLPEDEPAG